LYLKNQSKTKGKYANPRPKDVSLFLLETAAEKSEDSIKKKKGGEREE